MRERVQIRISPGPQQESQDLTSFLPQWPVFHCVGAHSGRCRLRHTGTFPERPCRRVVLPLTDCTSLLCWWRNHTQMRKTDHAISLMSPSGCYIKVQFRVTRPEQSAETNVVTFLLKSATPPFNSVTRCVSLSWAVHSLSKKMRRCTHMGLVRPAAPPDWVLLDEMNAPQLEKRLSLMTYLLFIAGNRWGAIRRFRLKI